MVIDLTNSSRYYEFDESDATSEFRYSGGDAPPIFYRKVSTVQNTPYTLSTCQHEYGYRETLICTMTRAARQ